MTSLVLAVQDLYQARFNVRREVSDCLTKQSITTARALFVMIKGGQLDLSLEGVTFRLPAWPF